MRAEEQGLNNYEGINAHRILKALAWHALTVKGRL